MRQNYGNVIIIKKINLSVANCTSYVLQMLTLKFSFVL
jgi:hypothetical protein